MLSFLKDHPFAVEAHFEKSIVLTFAAPKQELQKLIPDIFSLDTFEDQWAFVAVAMVNTKDLRPKGFPGFLGNDFFLVGYRIFVRYTNKEGKKLRGLYILGSRTNKKKMELLGNLFTHYNYSTIDLSEKKEADSYELFSKNGGFNVKLRLENEEVQLPVGSPFKDWKEARRFAGPLPFTFTYKEALNEVLIIEGVRQNWVPKPIEVLEQHFSFVDNLKLNYLVLANAFVIEDIPYYWKKGKREQWK